MANVFIEESTMTAIGNAIRAKTGKQDKILPSQMPSEINSITGNGLEFETGSITFDKTNCNVIVIYENNNGQIQELEINSNNQLINPKVPSSLFVQVDGHRLNINQEPTYNKKYESITDSNIYKLYNVNTQNSVSFNVSGEIPVQSIALNKTSLELFVGDTEQLTYTITPSNATDTSIRWESDKPNVVSVTNGLVEAKSSGIANIKVISNDGNFESMCTVNSQQEIVTTNDRQIFVMMGQSNMVGRGAGTSQYSVDAGRGYVYNHQTGEIIDGIVEPIKGANTESNSTSVSPVVSLAKAYTSSTTDKVPVINKSCKGNMYISEMDKGAIMYNLTVESTNALRSKLSELGNNITDIWGFWLQGESDAVGNMSTSEYKLKLTTLFENLKEDCGITKLFIIRVGYDLSQPDLNIKTQNIMKAQKQLCIERNDFIMLSNMTAEFSQQPVLDKFDEATMSGDGIHYTAYGYDNVGFESGTNLAEYVNTGKKPVLEENVPELEVEEQPETMVEYRYDFTKSLNAEAGGKNFSVVGDGYTLDSNGIKVTSPLNTTISLDEPIVLDNTKNWAIEFEATIDSSAPSNAQVGVPIGNRTGGIKDCVWFGIKGDNTITVVDNEGVTYGGISISDYKGKTINYKLVFISSEKKVYLVLDGKLINGVMDLEGSVSLRYLMNGYDNNETYNFKGYLKNLSIRYDVNDKVEIPLAEPEVIADFTFNQNGIINNNTGANALTVVEGREGGHSFTSEGIDLIGGENSGFLFQKPFVLFKDSKWAIKYQAKWRENQTSTEDKTSTSDGMLFSDNTSYDWCYGGLYQTGAGGNINKGKEFFSQMRTFVITNDPNRENPLKIEIDGVTEWEGNTVNDWYIKRFGAGYNIMKYGFPGVVSYFKIINNTIEIN